MMLFSAKNGRLLMDGTVTDYIRFGKGSRNLVILPGLGDALRSVKGTALPMAWMYRIFAREYTVYMFSRKNLLPAGSTTRDMARDLAIVMDRLGIDRADVMGVSMGGMIAQHLAADYPRKVDRLVLAVTAAGPNPVLTESVEEWCACARQGDHTAFMAENLRRIYSRDYCRKNGWLVPVMGWLTKPRSYDRFFVQAEACLTHNARDRLSSIGSPVLVIGGEKDLTLSGEASRELAEKIPGARLKMYPQWGHGLYEEAGDFNRTVLDFLTGDGA